MTKTYDFPPAIDLDGDSFTWDFSPKLDFVKKSSSNSGLVISPTKTTTRATYTIQVKLDDGVSSSTSSFNINVANRPAYFLAPNLTTEVTNVTAQKGTTTLFSLPMTIDLDGDVV